MNQSDGVYVQNGFRMGLVSDDGMLDNDLIERYARNHLMKKLLSIKFHSASLF